MRRNSAGRTDFDLERRRAFSYLNYKLLCVRFLIYDFIFDFNFMAQYRTAPRRRLGRNTKYDKS